ncbi:hypothetical protein, partial [Stenotrophomonas maltophilia]|uniref:hypothetical protein n=1 Tax=Stenotrophomonas maltophilia TaxID=40324 RepID=UPI0039C46E28
VENGSDPGHEKAGAFPGFFVVGWRAMEQLAGEGWLAVLRCWRATERCAAGRADRWSAALLLLVEPTVSRLLLCSW